MKSLKIMPMATILIVEDEPQIIAFLTKGLKKSGYQTQAEPDGLQALSLAPSGKFDLILLDLGLPSLDGREVLRKIRAQELKIPIIIVTAQNNNKEREETLSLGANAFIEKPFSFKNLLNCIRSHI